MDSSLKIKKSLLDETETSYDYLFVISSKYFNLIEKKGDNWMDHFTDEQHCLLTYLTLYDQVQNGGFIQMILNGFNHYIFDTPLITTLYEWGLNNTPSLLEKIKSDCNELADEIDNNDNTDLDYFSELYKKHPKFEQYDEDFFKKDDLEQVKKYVECHLSDFIIIE